MTLSEADKQRIYEEEKARIEARKQIKKEAKANRKKRRFRIPFVVGFIVIVISLLAVWPKNKPTPGEFHADGQGKFCYVNARSLNVRSGPGKDYEVIETLSEGQQVPVYEIKGDWAKVQNNPVPGYVWVAYLGNSERAGRSQ